MMTLLLALIAALIASLALTGAAYAADASLTVSSRYMAGPMVVEVIVSDPDLAPPGSEMPAVTLDGKQLAMVQDASGDWRAYFASEQMAQAAQNSAGFGQLVQSLPAASYAGSGADSYYVGGSVIRQAPPAETGFWPFIQLYDIEYGEVPITYADKRGAQKEASVLYLENAAGSGYVSVQIDMEKYQPGSDVILDVEDMMLNIDPTSRDSWTFNVSRGDPAAYYMAFAPGGHTLADGLVRMGVAGLGFAGNGLLVIDKDYGDAVQPTAGWDTVYFYNNGNQNFGTPYDPIREGPIIPGTAPDYRHITLVETGPNTGKFTSADDEGRSSIRIYEGAVPGNRGVIYYAGNEVPVIVSSTPAPALPAGFKAQILDPYVSADASDRTLQAQLGSPVYVTSVLANPQERYQHFEYIASLFGPSGQSLGYSRINGTLSAGLSSVQSVPLEISEPGTYTVRILAWSSMSSPVPLAPAQQVEFVIK